jgi:hypothetical protein
MSKLNLLPADLSMFDGAAAATGEANGSSSVAGESISGDTKAQAPAAGEAKTDKESRRKAYMELINGEFKDIHTEESQRMIDKRFKETKKLQRQIDESASLLGLMHARYGTNGDIAALEKAFAGDSFVWEGAAEQDGSTSKDAQEKAVLRAQVNAYKQREQVQKWNDEIAGIQEKYPEFDVDAEMQNPVTRRLLKSGVPLEHIYKLNHMDEFMGRAVETAVADTERRVTENIRAKGSRPDENGTQSSAGYVAKVDVSKLTREQRAEMAKKALRGETISF